jgi:fumarate reductase subunit D
MPRRLAPFLWLLFSAGGTVAAFVHPALLILVAFAIPIGAAGQDTPAAVSDLLRPPAARAALGLAIALPLFHWAHRFRYTLYDGLQLKHLFGLIAVLCYGFALVSTVVAACLLWTIP